MPKPIDLTAILTVSALCLLNACTTANVAFTGQSATFGGDNILRNDVFKTISDYERSANQCNKISAVNSRIIKEEHIDGLMRVSEVWQVQACTRQHTYPVFLHEDPNGETDYTVRLGNQERI